MSSTELLVIFERRVHESESNKKKKGKKKKKKSETAQHARLFRSTRAAIMRTVRFRKFLAHWSREHRLTEFCGENV